MAHQPYNGWPESGRSRVNAAGSPSKSRRRHDKAMHDGYGFPPFERAYVAVTVRAAVIGTIQVDWVTVHAPDQPLKV